jgi:branched-chain amino acid transport system substrate-binding protein
VCFIDPYQGRVIADFAEQTLHLRKVAVLTSVSSAYSVGLSKYFKERFRDDGGNVEIEQKYSEGDKDFKAQLTAIKATDVEGIFIPGYYTEAALICLQARELGMDLTIFGGDGWEAPELIQIGGSAMEGKFFSTHYSADKKTPEVQGFVRSFRARFNGETPDSMAALGYDSAMVLADAIRRAGETNGQAIRDAIADTRDFDGVTGMTTIDSERNATKAAVIVEVQDGKTNFVRAMPP